jgi:hypothetical protein
VSPVRYQLDFYILEDDIIHSHWFENLKSYTANNTVTCLTKGNDRIQDTVAPFLERQ